MAESTGVGSVMKYFGKRPGGTLAGFQAEWKALTDEDKLQLKTGIQNGTMTY